MITEGLTHTSSLNVTEAHTALAFGSGDLHVLATPAMMALMENAAMQAVASVLPEGSTTVGGHISSSHLRPTPVGATVTATAVLTEVKNRKLTFAVTAHEGDTLIGEGTHIRFIVDREQFLAAIKR